MKAETETAYLNALDEDDTQAVRAMLAAGADPLVRVVRFPPAAPATLNSS